MHPTYAITTVTWQRRTLFQTTENAQLLLDTLVHYRTQGRYQLHAFAIMPEHLHVLLTPSADNTVERCVQCIKGGFSHSIRKLLPGTIWQPGFFAHRIRDKEDFLYQRDYIAQNPIRRRLEDNAFVHTNYPGHLDTILAFEQDNL